MNPFFCRRYSQIIRSFIKDSLFRKYWTGWARSTLRYQKIQWYSKKFHEILCHREKKLQFACRCRHLMQHFPLRGIVKLGNWDVWCSCQAGTFQTHRWGQHVGKTSGEKRCQWDPRTKSWKINGNICLSIKCSGSSFSIVLQGFNTHRRIGVLFLIDLATGRTPTTLTDLPKPLFSGF